MKVLKNYRFLATCQNPIEKSGDIAKKKKSKNLATNCFQNTNCQPFWESQLAKFSHTKKTLPKENIICHSCFFFSLLESRIPHHFKFLFLFFFLPPFSIDLFTRCSTSSFSSFYSLQTTTDAWRGGYLFLPGFSSLYDAVD